MKQEFQYTIELWLFDDRIIFQLIVKIINRTNNAIKKLNAWQL